MCPRCHQNRGYRVDRATGKYTATYPSSCTQKNQCVKEIMAGWEIVAWPAELVIPTDAKSEAEYRARIARGDVREIAFTVSKEPPQA